MLEMKSTCCSEPLETKYIEELFHGSDDDYELFIPFQICTKCGKIDFTKHENSQLIQVGGRKHA